MAASAISLRWAGARSACRFRNASAAFRRAFSGSSGRCWNRRWISFPRRSLSCAPGAERRHYWRLRLGNEARRRQHTPRRLRLRGRTQPGRQGCRDRRTRARGEWRGRLADARDVTRHTGQRIAHRLRFASRRQPLHALQAQRIPGFLSYPAVVFPDHAPHTTRRSCARVSAT